MSLLQMTSLNGVTPTYPSQWYYQDTNWSAKTVSVAADRYTLQSAGAMQIDVGGVGLTQYSPQYIDLSVATNWDDYYDGSDWDSTNYTTASNRIGKDFYVYAVAPLVGKVPKFLVSAASTFPIGYSYSTSRKVAGFHCLCLAVGTISNHSLTGYLAGDILPLSVWDLNHKSAATYGNIGQRYNPETKEWVGIYPVSGTISAPTIIYGGTILRSTDWNDAVDIGNSLGMSLPSDASFQSLAAGSNEQKSILGKAAPSPFTSIGYTDTASVRMISNGGDESCCGLIWQWLDEQSYAFKNPVAHTHNVTMTGNAGTITSTAASADVAPVFAWKTLNGSKGNLYGQGATYYGDIKIVAGGDYEGQSIDTLLKDETYCGSRSRDLGASRWINNNTRIGIRLVAKSLDK